MGFPFYTYIHVRSILKDFEPDSRDCVDLPWVDFKASKIFCRFAAENVLIKEPPDVVSK